MPRRRAAEPVRDLRQHRDRTLLRGDDNGNATASVEFRPTGATEWRAGLPLWRAGRTDEEPGRAFYGSVLLLDAGKKYDVRITLDDPDGVRGERVIGGATQTRADNLPAAAP